MFCFISSAVFKSCFWFRCGVSSKQSILQNISSCIFFHIYWNQMRLCWFCIFWLKLITVGVDYLQGIFGIWWVISLFAFFFLGHWINIQDVNEIDTHSFEIGHASNFSNMIIILFSPNEEYWCGYLLWFTYVCTWVVVMGIWTNLSQS